jgi:hypothetical protein
VYHIENQLEEQPDLAEGDRRNLLEQLHSLTETSGTEETERRQVWALSLLRRIAPRAWEAALPAVQAILTAEIRQKLGLPPA